MRHAVLVCGCYAIAEEYGELAVTRDDRVANARRLNPDCKSGLAGPAVTNGLLYLVRSLPSEDIHTTTLAVAEDYEERGRRAWSCGLAVRK